MASITGFGGIICPLRGETKSESSISGGTSSISVW